MTDTDIHDIDEIELLLPWYVSGRLSASDRARVESWLEAHPDARAQLALMEEEHGLTIADNERLPLPSSAALDRLMARVAAEGGESKTRVSLLAQVGEWLSSLSPQVRGGLVAACLTLFAVQAATIGTLMRETGEPAFQTATGGATEAGPSLLVTFAADARSGAITALLGEVGGRIVDGPKPGGVYTIRLEQGADAAAAAAALKARGDTVTFVTPGS